MVFVTAVRDYIDWINASLDGIGQDMSIGHFVQHTCTYLASSLKLALLYLVTFQWLRDLAYLPVLIPQYTEAVIKEHLYFTQNPVLNVFSFTATPTMADNKFIIGWFNSLGAALPFSCAHLIAMRRFYVQGRAAAIATSLGIMSGHVVLLTAILLGWRPLILPLLQCEPWNYILGLTLLLRMTYNMSQSEGMITYHTFQAAPGHVFVRMGLGGFALTVCEQSLIFPHLSNFTFGLEPSFIEPATSTSVQLMTHHALYILGFGLGSCFWTTGLYAAAVGFRAMVTRLCRSTYVQFHARVHAYSKLFILTLTLSSIPFYGVDYMVTHPLGFVPYDAALVPGIFAPNTAHDLELQSLDGEVDIDREIRQDADIAGFDRGVYMRYMLGKLNPEDQNTFNVYGTPEDYRIPVEYAWMTETQRRPVLRHDFILRHKKSLERFYGWLEQTGTRDLFKMTETTPTRNDARSDGSANAPANAPPQGTWRAERFDQFTIVDNYTWHDEPFIPYHNEMEIHKAYTLTQDLLQKSDFESIENTKTLLDDLLVETATRQEETEDYVDSLNPPNTPVAESIRQQNFQEQVHYDQLSKITRQPEQELRFPWLWPGFNSYFPEELQENFRINHVLSPGPRQRKAQDAFLNNPYYTTLMRTDIDAFLARQPKTHLLTANEEAELYYKRSMLSDYYNSLRQYKRMNTAPDFQRAYGGVKSFANRVFNHQFTGTYRVARRLFAIDLQPQPVAASEDRASLIADRSSLREAKRSESQRDAIREREGSETYRRVAKYDMPLFDDTQSHNPMIHEELQKDREARNASQSDAKRIAKRSAHAKTRNMGRKPFFTPANTQPFYCGWDNVQRQFVLTNRLLPRTMAGTRMFIPTDSPPYVTMATQARKNTQTTGTPKKRKTRRNTTDIVFTWWPIPASVANMSIPEQQNELRIAQRSAHRSSLRDPLREAKHPDRERSASRIEAADGRRGVYAVDRGERHKLDSPEDIDLVTRFNPDFSELPSQAGTFGLSAMQTPPRDFEPWTGETWPSGFQLTDPDAEPGWWAKVTPAPAFAERGGYVWPGHAYLKIDVQRFIPDSVRPILQQAQEFYRQYLT